MIRLPRQYAANERPFTLTPLGIHAAWHIEERASLDARKATYGRTLSSAPTDLDPQTRTACPVCLNLDIDCICEQTEQDGQS